MRLTSMNPLNSREFAIKWSLMISSHLKYVWGIMQQWVYQAGKSAGCGQFRLFLVFDIHISQRRIWGVVESLMTASLQISFWVWRWKIFEHRSTLGEAIDKNLTAYFFWNTVYKQHKIILKSIITVRSIEPVVRNFRRKPFNVHLFQFLVRNFLSIFCKKKTFTFPHVFDKKFFRPVFNVLQLWCYQAIK